MEKDTTREQNWQVILIIIASVVAVVTLVVIFCVGYFVQPSSKIEIETASITVTYGDELDISAFKVQTVSLWFNKHREQSVADGSVTYDAEAIGTQTAKYTYKGAEKEFELRILPKQLDVPSALILQNGVLTWKAVSNAQGYVVSINNNEYEVENNFDIKSIPLSAGTLTIKVKAFSANEKYSDSEYSQLLTVTKLQDVSGLRLQNGVLYWDTVANAQGYTVTVNGESTQTQLTQYDLSVITYKATVVVQAICGENAFVGNAANASVSKAAKATNIRYDTADKKLYWTAPDNNCKWEVSINGEKQTVTTSELSVELDEGVDYNVEIVAVGTDNWTISSDTATKQIQLSRLAEPTNARILQGDYTDEYKVKFDAVNNADAYKVTIKIYNGETLVRTLTYTLTDGATEQNFSVSNATRIEAEIIAQDSAHTYIDSDAVAAERNI